MSEPLNFHAIVGPNGMCMCGVKADGTVVTCGALLDAQILERARAAVMELEHCDWSEAEMFAGEAVVGRPDVLAAMQTLFGGHR